MNKLFKTTALAALVAGSFSASAVTITSDSKLSSEGLAAGLQGTDVVTLNFVVDKTHPGGTDITLTFPADVDLSTLDLTAGAGGAFDNAGGDDEIAYDIGNGSFGFDNASFAIDNTKNTISWTTIVGQPMLAGSSFTLTLGLAAVAPVIDAAGTVSYLATDIAGDEVESGVGAYATAQSQFAFSVTKEFDGRIERLVQKTFVNPDAANDDLATVVFNNNEGLSASLTVTDLKIAALTSGLTDVNVAEFGSDPDTNAGTTEAISGKTVTFTVNAADVALVNGKDNKISLEYDFADGDNALGNFDVIPRTSFLAGVSVNTAQLPTALTIASDVDLGTWKLDAAIVNVPYLPLGYDSLSANVEFSNHGSTDAAVTLEAFDQDGNEYTGELADAAKKTVTKYSDKEIMDALDITEATKLNVTFIADANEDEVSVVPYYRQGDSRVQTINDQYKGKE